MILSASELSLQTGLLVWTLSELRGHKFETVGELKLEYCCVAGKHGESSKACRSDGGD